MSMRIVRNMSPREEFTWMPAASKWADEVGPMVRSRLKSEAPVGQGPRAGRLRDTIRYERVNERQNITLKFTAHTPYAKYVLEGTRPHEIYPKAARYLHFEGRLGEHVFVGPRGSGAHVNHPGTRPNPFNRRAMEEVLPDIKELFARIMREAMGGTS